MHSPSIIVEYLKMLHESISCNHDENDTIIIDGEGVVVQINDCNSEKRKHNRDHAVDGICIVGSVELTDEKENFW